MKKLYILFLFLALPFSSFAYFGQPYLGDLENTLPFEGFSNATVFPNGDGTYTLLYHGGGVSTEFGRNITGNGEVPFGGLKEYTIGLDGYVTDAGELRSGNAQFTYPPELQSSDIVSSIGFYFWPLPTPEPYINPYQPPTEDWGASVPAFTPWLPTPPASGGECTGHLCVFTPVIETTAESAVGVLATVVVFSVTDLWPWLLGLAIVIMVYLYMGKLLVIHNNADAKTTTPPKRRKRKTCKRT